MLNKNVKRVYEGKLIASDTKFAIACSRFNAFFVEKLLEGAIDSIVRNGGDASQIEVAWVPGAYELPFIAKTFAESKKYDAVMALGVVIQGATPHADLLNAEVAKGLCQVGMDSGVPVTYGLVTANNIEQAIERSGTKAGNKGADAALAAIEMVSLVNKISGE
jgi:6,7-dimethyl-8-ribityllumazine synthase